MKSVLVATLVLGLGAEPVQALARAPAAQRTPSEKELIDDFRAAFDDKDAAKRTTAVETLGEKTRQLPDKGVGKKVAQALVKGLEDEELEVCSAAVFQLSYGRDVDTVISSFDTFLHEMRAQIERRIKRTDQQSQNHMERCTVLFANGCRLLANYRDERSAAILVGLLKSLRANTESNDIGTRLVGPLASSVLVLGTLEAIEAAVKQTKTFSGPRQEPAGRELHAALVAFATKAGTTPPEWSADYSVAWHAWLEANRGKFNEILGRLTTPPTDTPGLAGLPGKSGG